MGYSDDPFFRYSVEELRDMTHEEFCDVIEESNKYVRIKYSQINEQEMPRFDSIEEFMNYYDCIPLDDILNNLDNLLDEL